MNWKAIFKLPVLLAMCSVFLAQVPKSAYPKREFKHHDTFRSENNVEDGVETTYVFLEHSVITTSEEDKTSISLMANFQYDGKDPVKPKHISIAFFKVVPKCTMPLHPDITF